MKPNISSPHFSLRNALALLTSAWILGGQLATAQGTAFTYQGQLADGGWPANGLYDLRFAIYDAAGGGSAVGGPLTNEMTAISNGVFTVTLDFGTSAFPGTDRWLEIGVRAYGGGAFTNLWPRQPISATPYAIRAANFSGTVAASQLTGTISPSNIGAGSINSTMLAAGAVGANQLAAGAVTTAALANGAVTASKISSVTVPLLLTTFTNPTPAVDDVFGWSLAAVGNDRVLIGATYDDTSALDAGAAYLLNANGTLLTTFTNPAPAVGDAFGWSVAAVGNDRVVIATPNDDASADEAGAAYLFSVNGALLTTFTNPTPVANDQFGHSVVALGADRVVISALYDGASGTDAGAAYLFRTNGVLLATFTNPTPASLDFFGYSMTAVGTDRVLISALYDDTGATDTGAAYLFSTNGALLTTFTNPTPAAFDSFGLAVTAVGNDRVLISAPFDDTGAANSGVVYLFTTGGTLLTTITNPTPAANDEFGRPVAAVGDRIVIAAPSDNTGASDSGSVYWFSTNGTLLVTLTNPTPASGDLFGSALAAVGNDRVLVGAFQDDAGASGAGAAYLFTIDTYTPGLVAQAVHFGGVTSSSIAAGAVTTDHIATVAVGADQLASAAVTTTALADGAVTADKMFTISNWFALTIMKPPPTPTDLLTAFGESIAAVGNDRMLIGASFDDIGAPNAGAAYLFALSGTLLTTFTNPTPASIDGFGRSMVAVGGDRVLIGAPFDDTGAANSGVAYLLSTSGALLITFTNPTPAANDSFGSSVAVLGGDRVLISAPGANGSGEAYLFRTNGALLATFTNPTPVFADNFGFPLVAVGSDRVLIGAQEDDAGALDTGAAYLFSTNGTLLTTFTNPAPAYDDRFGFPLAALGSDRVLIGARLDQVAGVTNAGAVYLFNINGTLLTTFTNPTPAFGELFGSSVAAVGNDRVLIGASQADTGGFHVGAAYLFSTNGALLTTFANPTPASFDQFGTSVAVLSNDRLIIGAAADDTVAKDAGAAYLFTLNSFTPGQVADTVKPRSVIAASLDDGAVTVAKLDPTIGVWTQSSNDVYRSSGNVGIGTTTPGAPLHIATPVYPVMVLQDTGPDSTQQSGYISFWNATPSETAWVGYGTEGSPHFSVVNVRPSGNIVLYTAFGPTLTATSSGLVGIRRTPTANALEVEGNNASKTVAGSWVANSDARIKTDVRTVTHALEKLEQVRPVEFRYTEAYRAQHPSIEDRRYLNVIAQEFQQVFPDAVKRSGDKLPDGDDILQVDTYPLTIYSAAAIQELNRKLDAGDQKSEDRNQRSETRIRKLETENAELKARLEHLERRLSKSHSQ